MAEHEGKINQENKSDEELSKAKIRELGIRMAAGLYGLTEEDLESLSPELIDALLMPEWATESDDLPPHIKKSA